MTLEMIGGFAGGVGLFLLGMNLMTQGLMQAAGSSLRRILAAATASPRRGLASGIGVTALVQSSSAVTVATIGFVNAELMQLSQAIPVIFGSNIGTTMTGWLVATLGFNVKISAFALPMIGIGMALRVMRGKTPVARIGEALAGFGLFFVGVDILKDTFGHLSETVDLSRYAMSGILGVLVYVLVGAVLTTLLQSSSAAMAMTLTAASGGAISLENAAALVIGANVGTTTTAILTVIGASPAAKRLAGAHVLFNVITAGIGLLTLPAMLWSIHWLQQVTGMDRDLSVLLALFHTFFNVMGVLVLWNSIGWMTRLLESRFEVAQDGFSKPKYLDPALTQMPALALTVVGKELAHSARLGRELAVSALNTEFEREPKFVEDVKQVQELLTSVGEYVARVQRGNLQPVAGEALGEALRVLAYQHAQLEQVLDCVPLKAGMELQLGEELLGEWARCREAVIGLLSAADPTADTFDPEQLHASRKSVQRQFKELKNHLLRAGAAEQVRVRIMVDMLDHVSNLRQLVDQAEKGARALGLLLELVQERVPASLSEEYENPQPDAGEAVADT